MLLHQRTDEALRLERLRSWPGPYLLLLLQQQKRHLLEITLGVENQ
jgi:hypothetical protein